jgi:hypothetical protein
LDSSFHFSHVDVRSSIIGSSEHSSLWGVLCSFKSSKFSKVILLLLSSKLISFLLSNLLVILFLSLIQLTLLSIGSLLLLLSEHLWSHDLLDHLSKNTTIVSISFNLMAGNNIQGIY